MSDRPQFLNTKAERRIANAAYDPIGRYRTISKGIYSWDGLPDDVPEGFIEESLFDYGCVSAKDVPGLGMCIFPAIPISWNIYNEPLSWRPIGVKSMAKAVDIMQPSSEPTLYAGEPTKDRIEIFANIAKSALISLQQNVIALRQPIALDGKTGNGADAIVLSNELEDGVMYIPVIDSDRIGVKVIDMKAMDHTQSLISTYNAMDSEILSIIGVKNVGTEKASGVTSVETLSINQELVIISDYGLKKRSDWCKKINTILGTNFSVSLSEAYVNVQPEQVASEVMEAKDKTQEEL